MERNVNIDVYMSLSKKGLAETAKAAEEAAMKTYDTKKPKDLLYEDVNWNADEVYFDAHDQSLQISGMLHSNGSEIGYFSPTIKISPELMLEMIQFYMKKLENLKLVMSVLK